MPAPEASPASPTQAEATTVSPPKGLDPRPALLERLLGSSTGSQSGFRLGSLPYVVLALVVTVPAWIVRHPPIQDLPFHLATLRVIHDLHDPAFGFDQDFYLDIFHTEYVFYYLVGSSLAFVVGVFKANVVMMCGYLGGTVLALRTLLLALRKDERLALFVVPLLVNVMFVMGLLPFMIGVPFMFWGLALSIRYFEEPTREHGFTLGLVAVALF